jgi:subtilisin family serine protease
MIEQEKPNRSLRTARTRRAARRFTSGLEILEPRVLLSASTGGANALLAEALLPNEAQSSTISFSDLWHLSNTGQSIQGQTGTAGADIGAPAAWNLSTGTRSVVVAVLDSGIDLTHPDLASNIYTKPADINTGFANDIHGWNFVDNNNNVQDTDPSGHGTLVAGVIGAMANNHLGVVGINWNVSILPVKILDTSGSADPANIISGINYVIGLKQAGVDVVAINASFASVSALDPAAGITSRLLDAIHRAGDNGILFVNAAGNEAANINALAALPGWSGLSNVLTVAATDNRDQLASYSNYGNQVVTLGAPGTNITTTYPGGLYYYASGTSLAAPMVAGAVGLLAAFSPTANAAQIRAAILGSVDADPALAGKTITGGRLDVYKALETLVGDVAPIGSFDGASNQLLAGWAFDANNGVLPVSVTLTANGHTLATLTADQTRSDLTSYLGSAAHGWTYSLANVPDGTYTIQAFAQDAAPSFLSVGAPVPLGTRTVTVRHTPIGAMNVNNLNVLNHSMIVGWVADPDTPQTPAYFRIDLDGQAGTTLLASENRPDLAFLGGTNHGFMLPNPGLTSGYHRFDLWGFDTTSGAAKLLASQTLMYNAAPIGYVDALSAQIIYGWTYDNGALNGTAEVIVRIDNVVFATMAATLPRPDLTGYLGSANHGFRVDLPALTAGQHAVSVSFIDSTSGAETLARTATLGSANAGGNHRPIGTIDVANAAYAFGWLYDADVAGGAVRGELLIDGTTTLALTANQRRADLGSYLGSSDHGYYIPLNLANTRHRIQLYALDPQLGNARTLVQTILIGPQPMGHFDLLSNQQLYGWAFLTNDYGQTAQVRLDVDSLAGPLYAADQTRNDLVAWIGSANHGYSITAPPLSAGTHTLTFKVLDPVARVFITIGSTQLTYP